MNTNRIAARWAERQAAKGHEEAPAWPKPAHIPAGDRLRYTADEGLT